LNKLEVKKLDQDEDSLNMLSDELVAAESLLQENEIDQCIKQYDEVLKGF